MNEIIRIDLPLDVVVPRKKKHCKKYTINLNYYRNWNRWAESDVKKAYQSEIRPQIMGLKFYRPIKLKFVHHKANRRKTDRSNFLSIHEKYFCDALVECGCIPDDNDEYIIETSYSTGEIDKNNPRVSVYIEEI